MKSHEISGILKSYYSSSESEVKLELAGSDAILRFDYEKDEKYFNSSIIFKNVRAIQFAADMHCPAWKIEAGCDQIVIVSDSDWVNGLKSNTARDMQNSWVMNHYMTYFEGEGCYEVVARYWEEGEENPGVLSES